MKKLLILISLFLICVGCNSKQNENDIFQKLEHTIEYIDPENSLYNDGFEICHQGWIFNYYNPQEATYSEGKNNLRKFILDNYDNKSYSDSGYLNIHFVINCKGKTGRYKVYENDLNLEPYSFNSDLKHQLLELTRRLKTWNPNVLKGDAVDSYMYISYKIKNGEIIEILP